MKCSACQRENCAGFKAGVCDGTGSTPPVNWREFWVIAGIFLLAFSPLIIGQIYTAISLANCAPGHIHSVRGSKGNSYAVCRP